MSGGDRLVQAALRAQHALASARHLLHKYAPSHHWLPHIDKDIAELREALAARDASGEAVATPHRDGYWTHKAGKDPFPFGSKYTSLEVYTQPPAPKVDGYAVLLFDKVSAPGGYWFAGIYRDKESADRLAAKNGKCEVRPMVFAAPQSQPSVPAVATATPRADEAHERRAFEAWWRSTGSSFELIPDPNWPRGYAVSQVQCAWQAWIAALKAASDPDRV